MGGYLWLENYENEFLHFSNNFFFLCFLLNILFTIISI